MMIDRINKAAGMNPCSIQNQKLISHRPKWFYGGDNDDKKENEPEL